MKRQIKILGFLFLLFGLLKADKCNIPIEIAVVIDVSDSFSVSDYPAIKNFIKTIANLFHISPHSSHLSVVTAGDFVKVPITFKSSSYGKKKLLQALEGLKDTGGSWSLDRAFGAVKENVFSKENGARNFLPHIAIVITNTVSQKQGGWSALAKTANELHNKKVNVYSIGVGNGPSFNELRLMVKDDSQVHHVDSFQNLINLAPELSADICKDNEDVLNVCQTPVDIGFIVDSSGSIHPYGYNNVKNFLKGISVLMGFKPDRTHIGVVLYSKVAKVAFKFGEHPHLRKLFRSIHNLPHWKDRTRIDLGLQTANNSLFSKEGGMRENVTKIAILLTDGEQTTENINDLVPLRVPADALKRRGITIFVIGIGKFFNRKQLLQIVDRRDQLIEASTFTELEEKVNDIATALCQQDVGVFIDFINRVYNVTENEKAMVEIAVTSGYVRFPVTIGVWTIPSTAAQEDFVVLTKNITFQPGETGPKLIEIDVIDDDIVEPTEAFTVTLISPVAVELGEPATVNIIDNDVPRICGSEKDDCHEYATCTDTSSGTHECTCNEGYTGDGWTCKGVVIDFMKRSYNVMENEKAVIEIAVTSGQFTKPMTVSLTTSPLTAGKDDYIKWTGSITFQPGETGPKSIEIEIIDDLIVENTEAFSVILAASKSVRLGRPVTVNIMDNDAVIDFEKHVHNVKENEKAVLRIVVTSGQINIPVTIRVATIPSTAGESDFFEVNESITFQTEEIGPKLFPIELVDDLEVESTETFIVSLTSSAPVKLGQPATVNILDNDVAKICGTNRDDCHVFALCTDTNPGTYECDCNEGYTGDGKTCTGVVIGFTKHVYNVKENEKAAVEITVTSGQVTTAVAVNVTSYPLTAGNDDFTAKTQSITFQPGETGPKLIEVDLVDDALVEPTEAFTVFLGTSATQVTLGEAVTVNIIDNDVGKICGTNKDDCHISASCTDIGPGTYECVCNEGYTGDGKICTEIYICGTAMDYCHEFATCTNTGPGTSTCTCNKAYTGNGKNCTAIEICGTERDDCHKHATCTAIGPEAYECTCNKGYTGNGKICTGLAIGFTSSVYNVKENEKAVVEITIIEGQVVSPVTISVITQTAGNDNFAGKSQSITFQPGETGPMLVEIDLVDVPEPTEVFTVSLSTSAAAVTLGQPATVNIIDNDDKGCALDIGFLIDSSSSMRNCNLKKETDFVKEIAGYFRISPEWSHTSIVVYSEQATLIKRFNESGTLKDFEMIVDKLPFKGGKARLDEAMYMAASTMFTAENGVRTFEVPKILIVLNDGAEIAVSQTSKDIASMLRKSEVQVVVVGVGEADKKELGKIVATPDDLIMVEMFGDAKEKVIALSKQFCPQLAAINECNAVRHPVDLRIGGCVSHKPLEIGVCQGKCSSGSQFWKRDGYYEFGCSCCQPISKATKTVILNCSMNTTAAFNIQEATLCACQSCAQV